MPPCNVIPTRQADGAQAVKFNFFDAKRYFFIKAIKIYDEVSSHARRRWSDISFDRAVEKKPPLVFTGPAYP